MTLTPGRIVHTRWNAELPALSNDDHLPCRVAIITGPPSTANGKLPVTYFPPYSAPVQGILEGDHWHDPRECPYTSAEATVSAAHG